MTELQSLKGHVAVITGASSGIGEATARVLGDRGANVVIGARRVERLHHLADHINGGDGEAVAVSCDVRDRGQVNDLIDTAVKKFGHVDTLINNAGIMPLAPMARCRMDDWDDMIDINLKGLLYGIGCALPIMLKQRTGHFINVSSVAGRKIFGGGAVYCGTKHAVHAISEGLREELAEQAKEDGNTIRVTVIAPGVVRTELPDSIRDDQTREVSRGYYDSFDHPLRSEDIADNIVYAMTCPLHVGINEILVRPARQVR